MAGSFSSPPDAIAHFKEQARDVLRNVQVLRHMATVGGFVDYDSVQVVPSEDGKGFEIYMLSPHRHNLSQQLRDENLTQMHVVNLALDLCAALTVCRRSGYCYANLKPGNVFHHGQHYHIGDIGFLPMYEMGRIALPEQYRNSYTPPELMDGKQPVNDTADVYALGLILYQAYNGGQLPGNDAVFGRLLLPPQYADYEMAEIILRACAPDPRIRWQGPEQMGLALMRYTQRNGMRDEPIIPPIVMELAQASQDTVEDFLPEEPVELHPEQSDLCPPKRKPQKPIFATIRSMFQEVKTKFPIRKHKKNTRRKLHKGWIVIGILASVLIVELAVALLLFG
jgi:serine/threonine protein kinase